MPTAASLAPETILTDTASLKGPIVGAADELPSRSRFVAGHPMAGSSERGVEAATAELFRSRPLILTRTSRTDDGAFDAVSRLVREAGARVLPPDASATID